MPADGSKTKSVVAMRADSVARYTIGAGVESLKRDLLLAADGLVRQSGDQFDELGKVERRLRRENGVPQMKNLGQFERVVWVAE